MAHYAFLDNNNIVTEVIVGRNEDEVVDGISDWESHYAELRGQVCKRTSYNSLGGQHKNKGLAYRKNYASIGYLYDKDRDAFIPPKPYASWTLDEASCLWEAPVPMPADENAYSWNEETQSWDLIDGPN